MTDCENLAATQMREQERLVLWTTEEIVEAMDAAGVTQAELARRLGTSRAHVSALLRGRRNMTLRTLAEVAHALGRRVEISLAPLAPPTAGVDRLPVSQDAVAEFCLRRGIRRLALFGSVLRDDFRPDSDVDVLVEFEPGHVPGLLRIARMEDELSTLLGRRVDLNTAEDLSRYFRDDVVRHAEVIYDAGSAHAA